MLSEGENAVRGDLEESNQTSKEAQDWPLYNARDHDQKFSPLDYLNDFYSTAKEDVAMQIVLFFLPGILYRLPSNNIETVLDLGSGPTIHASLVMRNRASNLFSSDYAEVNRETLTNWIKNQSPFDWKNVCEWIGGIEATQETAQQMENNTRQKMRAVLNVDVHKQPVIRSVHYKVNESIQIPTEFDVVITIFCLEYASETLEEYRRAVRNATTLIKSGGFLVQGGVLEANEYGFSGRRFKSCFIRKENVLEALKESGLETTEGTGGFHFITHDEIFLLISKKL
ncbi:Nicotinamide N-methyltransferase [Aphelenchoides besseyi]|nr:Nicotinamide N-methyltransferase [Aphelenchoides besseyi]